MRWHDEVSELPLLLRRRLCRGPWAWYYWSSIDLGKGRYKRRVVNQPLWFWRIKPLQVSGYFSQLSNLQFWVLFFVNFSTWGLKNLSSNSVVPWNPYFCSKYLKIFAASHGVLFFANLKSKIPNFGFYFSQISNLKFHTGVLRGGGLYTSWRYRRPKVVRANLHQ